MVSLKKERGIIVHILKRFRRKTDTLGAIEFPGDEKSVEDAKEFLCDSFVKSEISCLDNKHHITIRTFHGQEVVSPGEMIVKEAGYYDHYSKQDFFDRFECIDR